MRKNNMIMLLVSAVLVIVGAVLLCISIFGKEKSNTMLCASLACILASNLLNIFRNNIMKKIGK